MVPKGKKGRKATNYLLAYFGGGTEVPVSAITAMMDEPSFEQHLPVLLNLDPQILDEGGTTVEIIQALMGVIEEMFRAFGTEEVETALKNLPEEGQVSE